MVVICAVVFSEIGYQRGYRRGEFYGFKRAIETHCHKKIHLGEGTYHIRGEGVDKTFIHPVNGVHK